jgi:hypothetical protein
MEVRTGRDKGKQEGHESYLAVVHPISHVDYSTYLEVVHDELHAACPELELVLVGRHQVDDRLAVAVEQREAELDVLPSPPADTQE